MHADTLEAAQWWAHPRGADSQSWIANYQRSLTASHRVLISKIVGELQAETVFEIGAHCGPNLVRLAMDYPTIQAHGIDVNVEAITAGKAWVTQRGFADRVHLTAQRFPEGTQRTPTGFVDVALSCYTLGYVAPADLDDALYELGRIATRAIIIAEPMTLDGETKPALHRLGGLAKAARNIGNTMYSEWAHDYRHALEWIGNLRGATTRIVPVTPAIDRLNAILVVERRN